MTRHKIYNSPEEAKKGNLEKSILRMKRLYEDPEYRRKHLDGILKRYYDKKQEFSNMKAQLQAYQNQSMMID
jgi:hypothetical protein